MGYRVKWIDENLGVTRKALRVFEKKGLMPPNEGGCYRDYDENDIDRIWHIRVLQGMGYSLKEIADMVNNEDFDFDNSIAQKVIKLEEEKKKVELHLAYAKKIKLTGRFPLRPQKIGEIRSDEFQKEVQKAWSIANDSKGMEYARLAETMLSKSAEEWENSDLGCFFSVLESVMTMDIDTLLAEYVLPKAIIKRRHLGAAHPDIQSLVKLIYESYNNYFDECGIKSKMSVKNFSRYYASGYLAGDIAKLKTRELTQEECEFIIQAVAIFGGFNNYDELIEAEQKYDRQNERQGEGCE